MAEKEYIEREALLEIVKRTSGDYAAAWSAIRQLPAADVAPVVHGEWIDRDEKTWCNVCHASNKQYKPLYCPHCGAKMDGGKHRERSKPENNRTN